MCRPEATPVGHSSCGDQRNWHAVVSEKSTDSVVEVRLLGQGLERKGERYHEKCKHDGNSGATKALGELSGNDLYAVLQVYP